ncbi:hypothetical protein MKleb_4921 [Klebsiella sp. PL-2018]|nr:hypothetical protein MKleb_4921 [Klebsiella sp. PL-2018]
MAAKPQQSSVGGGVMSHKTKAALQSRSCRFTALNSNFQDITVIDLVNSEAGNPASETGIPVSAYNSQLNSLFIMQVLTLRTDAGEILSAKNVADAVPQSVSTMHFCIPRVAPMVHHPLYGYVSRCEENRISLLMNFSVYLQGTAMAYTSQSFGSSLDFSQRRQINRVVTSLSHSFLELVGSFPSKSSKWQVLNAGPIHPNYLPSSRYSRKLYRIIAIHVLGKGLGRISFLHHKVRMCNKNVLSHLCASSFPSNQPFGSIPCRRNSARANSFIQLPRLTPSRSATSFNCWRSSGLILIWKVGDQPSPLGVLSRLIVDTYVHNLITWILLCTYVNTSGIEKTTPQTVGAVLGRLTKPLTGVTIMAELQHTQTRPKYQYRFLALNRHDKQAKPCRLSVEATTEREARSILAPHFILSQAARLPVQEVRHV